MSDPTARRRRLTWMAGITIVAAVLAIRLLWPSPPDEFDVRQLARLEPLPVQIARSSGVNDPMTEARLRGLESYRDGRYEDAVEALRQATPSGEMELWVYLGSALALLDQTYEAGLIFERIAALAGRTDLRDLALWQLANTQLTAGDGPAARATLVRLRDLDGAHAAEAGELLAELD